MPSEELSTLEEGVRYLRAQDLCEGEIISDDPIYISHRYFDKIERSHIKPGDLLFSIMASIGNSAVVPDGFPPATANRAVGILSPFTRNKFLTWYLFYLFSTELGEQLYTRIKKGGLQRRTNLADVEALEFPLPPIAKQEELVTAMDEARSQRKRKLAEADNLITQADSVILEILGLVNPPVDERRVFATQLHNIYTDGRIDVGYYHPMYKLSKKTLESCPYSTQRLDQLCHKPVGGATPKKGDQELYTNSGIKFLRILNIKPNEIDLADVKYIRPEVHEGLLKRSQLDIDDILMTITGRVGTAAVVKVQTLPANINQHIVKLKMLDARRCLPDYLAAYLNTSFGLLISNRSVTGGTRIALDYGAIQAIPIPLPPIEIQELIIAEVEHRREEAQRLRSEAEAEWQATKQWFEEQLLGFAPL